MIYRLVHELAADDDRQVDVAVACRVLGVSRSGYYEWVGRPRSPRAVGDAALTTTITKIHATSRTTYGLLECMPSCGWA